MIHIFMVFHLVNAPIFSANVLPDEQIILSWPGVCKQQSNTGLEYVRITRFFALYGSGWAVVLLHLVSQRLFGKLVRII